MTDIKVLKEFKEYGSKMKLLAIFTIIETFLMIPPISIIVLVLTLTGLKHIKNANKILNNSSLKTYYSKYKKAAIIRFITSFVILIWLIYFGLAMNIDRLIIYIGFGLFTLIGLILKLSYGVIELKAWKKFIKFFEEMQDFPRADKGIDASKSLKTAALMDELAIFAITIFIGWIYRIIGYFKLGNFKKVLEFKEPKPTVEATFPQKKPIEREITQPKISYCPFCGAEVELDAKICVNCGAPLKKNKNN